MKYYHNWPIGHGMDFPITFNDNGTASFPERAANWLARPLIKAIKNQESNNAIIERKVNKAITRVLLLNCLDPCYGHVLWKLFNAHHYREVAPPEGLAVLIPKNCVWLVPDFAAEIWSVEVELDLLGIPIPAVDQFIRDQTDQYESVRLLPGLTHIDHQDLDMKSFLRTTPFDLSDFQKQSACITFIWREDRLWLGSAWEEWLSLFATKYNVAIINKWLVGRQISKMKQVAAQLLQQLPAAKFYVTGLGRQGVFPGHVNDLRRLKADSKTEMEWCEVYAKSHLVIGVHGSNMIIPTALSAGFIELLPKHKVPFMAEDILMKHPARFQTFLGRHLDLYSAAEVIVEHAVSMIEDFGYLYKNTMARP
jgi:hypothetical protein